ncbi:SRPBCC family protein [Salinisphaera sp. T31B1]|uniref:SRPBCC family protein n=1 Tax=Salinisphaera sp. T31B1 TaxID=727963 RepID=UPI00334130FE
MRAKSHLPCLMQSLHVDRIFETDAATAFDVIADHAGYARLPGIRSAELRVEGHPERNGVGAERVLRLPGATFVERITEYRPGVSMAYRIIESPLPIEHIGARLLIEPLGQQGARCRVHWTSRLRATTRVATTPVEIAIARQMAIGYALALRVWARRLR